MPRLWRPLPGSTGHVRQLSGSCPKTYPFRSFAPVDVILTDRSIVQPDIVFVDRSRLGVLDPEARAVEAYALAPRGYTLAQRASGDAPVSPPPFEGLALVPAALWPAALDR